MMLGDRTVLGVISVSGDVDIIGNMTLNRDMSVTGDMTAQVHGSGRRHDFVGDVCDMILTRYSSSTRYDIVE